MLNLYYSYSVSVSEPVGRENWPQEIKPSAWSQQAAGGDEFIIIALHLKRDLSCFPVLVNRGCVMCDVRCAM